MRGAAGATGLGPSARDRGNVIPQIGDFDDEGWTGEEGKMMAETRKILGLPDLAVTATCVPRAGGGGALGAGDGGDGARAERRGGAAGAGALSRDPACRAGPRRTPRRGRPPGATAVFVGRIRKDPVIPNTLHLWVVADNLRKGAATNAVQIVQGLRGG
jgi:aspartate-semialdehyde dehydrogenase